jgi:Flp pilus assembly protein TadD
MGFGVGRWGALLAALVLVAGCTEMDKPENKIDLSAALLQAAASAEAQGDWLSAANYYRTAFADKPDSEPAAVGLMRSLRLVGGLPDAQGVAEVAVAKWPKEAPVLAEAGKVELAAGKLDESVGLLKRAIDADGKDWRTRSDLGLAYDRLGRYDDADAAYKEALQISPDNASILNNYGMSRAMANDLQGARTILLHAVMMPNADIRVRQNLALVYALSGDIAKAEQLTRQDLPPALANATLDYYRQLAAVPAETKPQ